MEKVIDVTEQVKTDIVEADEFQDIAGQINRMILDGQEKIQNGRYNLANQLMVTSKKYCTINGIDHLYTMARERGFDSVTIEDCMEVARSISSRLAGVNTDSIEAMKKDLENKFYNQQLVNVSMDSFDHVEYINELANIEVMQSIGSVCDDIIEFSQTMDEEISKLTEKLEEMDEDRFDHWLHTTNRETRIQREELDTKYNDKITELMKSYAH